MFLITKVGPHSQKKNLKSSKKVHEPFLWKGKICTGEQNLFVHNATYNFIIFMR